MPVGIDEVLAQDPPETGRMIGGDADVLVEVEQLDSRPVHARALDEMAQEGELRVAGGGDDAGTPAGGDGFSQDALGVLRRGGAHRIGIGRNVDAHSDSLAA